MHEVIRSGDADFVAMARPFVREPDLVNKIAHGPITELRRNASAPEGAYLSELIRKIFRLGEGQ